MGVNKVKAFQTIEGYNLMCVSPPPFFLWDKRPYGVLYGEKYD